VIRTTPGDLLQARRAPFAAGRSLCGTLAGVATLAAGSELAGYRIDEVLGRGGMGVVYRGTDVRLGRTVAIKLIAAERASEPTIRRRFEREARLMAAIDHPHVLPVYAAGEEHGCLYLVMRYVAGTDLAALLKEQGWLAPARAVHITDQLADALDAAHRAGLVHRDIKPANVLIAGDRDHVYLSDFGIGRAVEAATRLTDTHDWLGTVDFCSPEQLRGEPTDTRSDVYSLGCVLYTLLTGTPPHHRETTHATMFAHLNEPSPPPSRIGGVPVSFDAVLARALAKRPARRYAAAGELAAAARAALPGGDHGDPAVSGGARQRRPPLRPRRPRRADLTRRHGQTAPSATRRLRGATRTWLDLRPRPEDQDERAAGTHAAAAARGPARAWLAALLLAGLVATIAAAGWVLASSSSSGKASPPAGPLTQGEIAGVVQRFAAAYGHRDPRALTALLAPTVTRVTGSSVEHGRPAVVAQYDAQLADRSVVGYRLTRLQFEPGWIGRAAGSYEILRTGEANLVGGVTFAVERIGGRAEIALIATHPAG